jgi:histidine kinase/DNA gyrase B/HSP90-like ATPase
VTRIVEIPASFDERAMDQFAAAFESWPPGERLLFDARGTQWASPYAFVAMLTAAQAVREQKGEQPIFYAPTSEDVCRYWARIGFFRHAAELFEVHGKIPRTPAGPTETLLDVTPIRGSDDVHAVVGRVQESASRILGELGLETRATIGFTMALSEACQNIVEHAGTSGWVAAQAYDWRRRIGARVAVIAVSDAGIGFRRSLDPTQAKRFGDRWSDATALEAAWIQNISRFRDPGRGQGLAGIKRYLSRWDGKITIRSGTARLASVPEWDADEVPMSEHLPFFPGAQVQVILAARAQS